MFIKNEKLNHYFLKVINDIFYISLITFLIFSVIELFLPKFITSFVNMNILLITVFITGIITILNNKQ